MKNKYYKSHKQLLKAAVKRAVEFANTKKKYWDEKIEEAKNKKRWGKNTSTKK